MTDSIAIVAPGSRVGDDCFVIVDLECTCWERESLAPRETIEIGSVAYRPSAGVVGEFATFVRPTAHPTLSEFCTGLTTIRQNDVDDADAFPDAYARWLRWADGFEPTVFASWGDFDHRHLTAECSRHGVTHAPQRSVNLKAAFAAATDGKRRGMAGALRYARLPLKGAHHRGIDDARNIATLLEHLLRHHAALLRAHIREGRR